MLQQTLNTTTGPRKMLHMPFGKAFFDLGAAAVALGPPVQPVRKSAPFQQMVRYVTDQLRIGG